MTPENKSRELAARIRHASGCHNSVMPLHEPMFIGNEWHYVKECLDTGWVSSQGKFVDQFERDLESYTGSNHAIAVMNGTAALHLALLGAGVKAGDEVLTPSLSFVATANAICYCGATPHFVDVESLNLGLDATSLDEYLNSATELRDGTCYNCSTGRVIRALVVMHTFGIPSEMEAIQKLCKQYSLALVEDAAEGLGSHYQGQHVGTFGVTAALSFNGNKIMTTGGGGAVLCQGKVLAERLHHLSTTAKLKHPWQYHHDAVGYNYRMPNLNAALGCAQLEQMPEILRRKRTLHESYQQYFPWRGIELLKASGDREWNYWLMGLSLPSDYKLEIVLEELNSQGILARPVWQPLHQLPMFEVSPRMDLSCTERLASCIINIPSSAGVMDDAKNF
ncbi:LegC family aminotransferase [Dongshaea marina]|uniref:LegC family aminotransferase n=1 Tax=Dongshaea marina TaxID=2047966 RepID=UPI000D3EAF04|nr:LegC family aminotransferase [Dongshaea marina]